MYSAMITRDVQFPLVLAGARPTEVVGVWVLGVVDML
jgi:hypothetical protein